MHLCPSREILHKNAHIDVICGGFRLSVHDSSARLSLRVPRLAIARWRS